MNKKQIEPLTREEMERLMDVVEQTDEFDFMLFSVLKTTGRRIGELMGIEEVQQIGRQKVGSKIIYVDGREMKVDRTIPVYKKTGYLIYGVRVKDIDFERNIMKVWVLKRRKYIQDETILIPEVTNLIRKHINKCRLNLEDYAFGKKGRRTLQNRIKTYAKRAGINHSVVIHNFRHYFITEFKRKGWSNDKIAKLTGHKSSSTIAIYDHIVAEDIREDAMEVLKNL